MTQGAMAPDRDGPRPRPRPRPRRHWTETAPDWTGLDVAQDGDSSKPNTSVTTERAGRATERGPHAGRAGQRHGRRLVAASQNESQESQESQPKRRSLKSRNPRSEKTQKKAPTKSKVAKGHTWGAWGARPPKIMRSGARKGCKATDHTPPIRVAPTGFEPALPP
jgi:hypothetical protein